MRAVTANLEGGRANPALTSRAANNIEPAAEAAPGGSEAGGVEGCARAAKVRRWVACDTLRS